MTTTAHSSTSRLDPTHAEMHVDDNAAVEVPGEASQITIPIHMRGKHTQVVP